MLRACPHQTQQAGAHSCADGVARKVRVCVNNIRMIASWRMSVRKVLSPWHTGLLLQVCADWFWVRFAKVRVLVDIGRYNRNLLGFVSGHINCIPQKELVAWESTWCWLCKIVHCIKTSDCCNSRWEHSLRLHCPVLLLSDGKTGVDCLWLAVVSVMAGYLLGSNHCTHRFQERIEPVLDRAYGYSFIYAYSGRSPFIPAMCSMYCSAKHNCIFAHWN